MAPLLQRLVTPTRTRARIFDREGSLLLDSRTLYSRGDVLRFDLPPLKRDDTAIERTWNSFLKRLGMRRAGGGLPAEEIGPSDGRAFPEVQQALAGTRASVVRLNDHSQTIVSVAVPVQRFQAVRGVLLLSTLGGDIDAIIASERFALLQVFLIAALVMVILSVLLAGAIVGPVRRLAEAAERVRSGTRSPPGNPGFHEPLR